MFVLQLVLCWCVGLLCCCVVVCCDGICMYWLVCGVAVLVCMCMLRSCLFVCCGVWLLLLFVVVGMLLRCVLRCVVLLWLVLFGCWLYVDVLGWCGFCWCVCACVCCVVLFVMFGVLVWFVGVLCCVALRFVLCWCGVWLV